MTLRRATILAHGLLVLALVAAAAYLVWISLAYEPDPEDPWPVGPGFIAIPMAIAILFGAAAVAFAVWRWMRSGNRATLGLGDLVAAITVAMVGVLMPAPLALGALGTLVVAGATVAANKTGGSSDGATLPAPRRSPVVVLLVIVAAVVIGATVVAPMLWSASVSIESIP